MIKIKLFFLITVFTINVLGQALQLEKVEPPNWWTGMHKKDIQLMIYGKNLNGANVTSKNKNISVKKIYNTENSDYLFVDVSLNENADAGEYNFIVSRNGEEKNLVFPVLKRQCSKNRNSGFGNKDIVYLIMPDRFADGDTSNNISANLINDFKPGDPLGRHGGDLIGIKNNIPYLKELGVTALWLTPVLENNTSISYHGYAASDLYKIDERLGTNEVYKDFVNEAHKNGIKIIYDHVSNHISVNHPWVKNPPTKDWINGQKGKHLNAWHDKMILWDIHGSPLTKKHVTEGWFVNEMADLNQNNLFVKNYLIQNTIWWIEFAGIDGIREDTYPYVFSEFSSKWAKEILNEYPKFNIVGEVWTGETAYLAPFQKGSRLNKNFNTNLPVVTDFALQNAYEDFLKGKSGLYSIFDALAKDFLYENPNDLLIFADNHDVARAMFNANDDVKKVKIIFTHLFTTRGIPQILYGTEIGIVGNNEHGYLRADFRGGFPGDSSSAFTSEGRNDYENDLFNFFKNLISTRKKYKSLSAGTLQHLPPINNVYMYVRKFEDEKILIVLNGDDKEKHIDIKYVESLCGEKFSLKNIHNDETESIIEGKLLIAPLSAGIFKVE